METATADQHETLEVELRANFDFGNDLKSAWWGVPETEVVAGLPNEELTQVQEVNKDTGDNQQVISAETKKSVTDKKHRGHWGKNEQEGLEPGNCVLGERAVEEEVLKGFDGAPQKQGRGTGKPKETRRCAVQRTPCAIFQERSRTWRSKSKRNKERQVEGQSSEGLVTLNLSMQCGGIMFSDSRYK